MCRFVAYHGLKPIQLKTILTDWPNSLISQSRLARESRILINGDGFGIGWYNREADNEPAVLRSVRPAWNDANLNSIASKVLSTCCVAHIRASTVGDVALANCHPFFYKEFLFVHNGTVENFSKIRKQLLCSLSDPYFSQIKGQTDSEHLFYKIIEILEKKGNVTTKTVFESLQSLVQYLNDLLEGNDADFRINCVFTNGEVMAVMRYTNHPETLPHTLYYSVEALRDGILVASEKLTENGKMWHEIPHNHVLLIEKDNSFKTLPIK